MKKLFLAFIAVLLLAFNALAVSVRVDNQSGEKVIYRIKQIDHKFPQLIGPFMYAMGELPTGKIVELKDRSGRIHTVEITYMKSGIRFFAGFRGDVEKFLVVIPPREER